MDRILLVDDDSEVLYVNGEFLRGKGYQVKTAQYAALHCPRRDDAWHGWL